MLLNAEFNDRQSIAAAIAALQARGFGAGGIEVYSAQPLDLPDGLLKRPSHMSLAAVAAATGIGLLAIVFVRATEYSYPVVTGGMPLFSWWASGVIFYEFTMFGAIAGTLGMFLLESGLLRRGPSIPAPNLTDGRIHVRISCEPENIGPATECLYLTGATRVEMVEKQ
ncbi:MAG: quinol:electron acceptor oxidoreductase subunit ActD [Bryobacteraceae bacterium]|jgi:hypothetical protein